MSVYTGNGVRANFVVVAPAMLEDFDIPVPPGDGFRKAGACLMQHRVEVYVDPVFGLIAPVWGYSPAIKVRSKHENALPDSRRVDRADDPRHVPER